MVTEDPYTKPFLRRATDYRGITEDMLQMLEYKQADYGANHDPLANIKSSAEFGIPPWVAALVRAGDKMARLKTVARGHALKNESVEDSLMDLANYAVIALRLFREDRLAKEPRMVQG